MNKFELIVVGVGAMGSAACYHLARRGHRALGLEQFDIVHELGSHGGQSRIIRKAYFEHPDYVPLLERAYKNWATFELECGVPLYYKTGILYFGEPDHPTIEGVRHSARVHNIPLQHFEKDDVRRRFPQFHVTPGFECLFEPDAGFITPDRAIRMYSKHAGMFGAEIRTGERVLRWKKTANIVEVETDKDVYTADRLILTAGSWTSKLVPSLAGRLDVTRQTLVWLRPGSNNTFGLSDFPCWFVEDPAEGMFYGFPVLPTDTFDGPVGMKLASHRRGIPIDPDMDRHVDDRDISKVLEFSSRYLPAAGNDVIAAKTCLYTYSPDEHFIIDFLPAHDGRVVVACGFSGHGFKFVSVVGEALADLAVEGKTTIPIGLFSLGRFG